MICIQSYLLHHRVPFRSILHRPQSSASRRAGSIGIPGDRVAKAVLVHTWDRVVLAVLPSTRWVLLGALAELLNVERIRLATILEVAEIFKDCERGAIPPFGRYYGIEMVVDTSLAGVNELLVETNLRHQDFVLRYRDYEALERPIRGRFSRPICSQAS